jgi:hypothetical protein
MRSSACGEWWRSETEERRRPYWRTKGNRAQMKGNVGGGVHFLSARPEDDGMGQCGGGRRASARAGADGAVELGSGFTWRQR